MKNYEIPMTAAQTCTWICESFLEAVEACEDAQDCYAETRSQHQAETAAFGDSWPGAALDVGRMRDGLDEAYRTADSFASALGLR